MVKTKIEWCDSTWNPVTGCRHGCSYCYAKRIAERFQPQEGALELEETKAEERYYELEGRVMVSWKDGKKRACAYPYGFQPTLHRYRMEQPQKWVNPQNVFVCSMADLFGSWVPDEWIEEVMRAADEAPRHRYLFLTKNPDRYSDLYAKGLIPTGSGAWNKWYGCTITKPEDKYCWINEDAMGIDHYGFLSIEPLLADFPADVNPLPKCISWIIIGAESGNRKDKVTPKKEWVQHICEAADRAKLPVFMKDSLIPIMGKDGMRREFPWGREG